MKPTKQPRDSFAAMLREVRAKRKMTQVEAAKKLGIPTATLSNWEQGRNCPDKFKQIAVLAHLN